MSEEGWGCGYQVLINKGDFGFHKIDRDKLYSLRHGLMIFDKEKGHLIRGEKTLNQLIDEARL
jgi:hypothetical protein